MADLYFFEVVWEVGCLREDEWKTGRCVLRSAVQVVSDSLFRFGPDMLEVEDPYVCPDPDGLIGMAARNAGFDLSGSGYYKIPREPRIMVASHGQRLSPKQVLYELWEDSGLQLLAAEMFFIEPLIYCHAFKALLDHVRDGIFPGSVSDLNEIAMLTARGRLCVKKKSKRIETVLTSEARITAENGKTLGMDLYSDLRHTSVPEQKIQYALLVPDEADFSGKPVQAGQIEAGLPLRVGGGANPIVSARTPGEPSGDFVVFPVKPGGGDRAMMAPSVLASGFLAYMNFYEEPSGLLWIF